MNWKQGEGRDIQPGEDGVGRDGEKGLCNQQNRPEEGLPKACAGAQNCGVCAAPALFRKSALVCCCRAEEARSRAQVTFASPFSEFHSLHCPELSTFTGKACLGDPQPWARSPSVFAGGTGALWLRGIHRVSSKPPAHTATCGRALCPSARVLPLLSAACSLQSSAKLAFPVNALSSHRPIPGRGTKSTALSKFQGAAAAPSMSGAEQPHAPRLDGVAKPLPIIVEKSWQSGEIPTKWKRGKKTRIFKVEKGRTG